MFVFTSLLLILLILVISLLHCYFVLGCLLFYVICVTLLFRFCCVLRLLFLFGCLCLLGLPVVSLFWIAVVSFGELVCFKLICGLFCIDCFNSIEVCNGLMTFTINDLSWGFRAILLLFALDHWYYCLVIVLIVVWFWLSLACL